MRRPYSINRSFGTTDNNSGFNAASHSNDSIRSSNTSVLCGANVVKLLDITRAVAGTRRYCPASEPRKGSAFFRSSQDEDAHREDESIYIRRGETVVDIAMHDIAKDEWVIWLCDFNTPDGNIWRLIEKGSSHMVYRNVDLYSGRLGGQVYKIPIKFPLEVPGYLAPSRCVNRWNQRNANNPAKLYGVGWVAPFVYGGEPYVCDKIIKYIVNEYKRVGRILVNAYLSSNFRQFIAPDMLRSQNILENLNLSDDQGDNQDDDQEIVCINTQFALNLHPDPARASVDSLMYWKEEEGNYKKDFLSLPSVGESYKVMQVITTLLIINKYFPDVNLDLEKEKCKEVITNMSTLYFRETPVDSAITPDWLKDFLYSEEALSTKDDRGKALFDYGLRGDQFREIYRKRAEYPTANAVDLLRVERKIENMAKQLDSWIEENRLLKKKELQSTKDLFKKRKSVTNPNSADDFSKQEPVMLSQKSWWGCC